MNLIQLSNGLALALNYDRKSLWNISAGRNSLPFQEIVVAAKDFICNYDSILATSNKLNSQIYAFRSKNFYGMRDQIQIEAVSNQSGDIPNQSGVHLEELPEVPADDLLPENTVITSVDNETAKNIVKRVTKK